MKLVAVAVVAAALGALGAIAITWGTLSRRLDSAADEAHERDRATNRRLDTIKTDTVTNPVVDARAWWCGPLHNCTRDREACDKLDMSGTPCEPKRIAWCEFGDVRPRLREPLICYVTLERCEYNNHARCIGVE